MQQCGYMGICSYRLQLTTVSRWGVLQTHQAKLCIKTPAQLLNLPTPQSSQQTCQKCANSCVVCVCVNIQEFLLDNKISRKGLALIN